MSRPASLNRRKKAGSKHAQRLETLGLIVIVILILALVIARSCRLIAWSAR